MLGNVLHFGPDPEYPPAIVYPPSNHITRPKKTLRSISMCICIIIFSEDKINISRRDEKTLESLKYIEAMETEKSTSLSTPSEMKIKMHIHQEKKVKTKIGIALPLFQYVEN